MPARCPGGQGCLRRPQLGALLLFLPRVSRLSRPQRSRTGTRPLTSKPCDVKYVPAERHFRRRWGGAQLGGGAVRPRPRPRLVLRGQLLAQRREVGGAKGPARRDGTGRGLPTGCRVGVPREPRLGRRAGGRLSFAGGPAQPAGDSEAESLRCGEGEEGARLLGRQHLRPTFLGVWRRSPRKCRRDPGGRPLFDVPPKWLRLHPGAGRCCTGFWVRLRPGSTSCEGILVPHPVPNPTP